MGDRRKEKEDEKKLSDWTEPSSRILAERARIYNVTLSQESENADSEGAVGGASENPNSEYCSSCGEAFENAANSSENESSASDDGEIIDGEPFPRFMPSMFKGIHNNSRRSAQQYAARRSAYQNAAIRTSYQNALNRSANQAYLDGNSFNDEMGAIIDDDNMESEPSVAAAAVHVANRAGDLTSGLGDSMEVEPSIDPLVFPAQPRGAVDDFANRHAGARNDHRGFGNVANELPKGNVNYFNASWSAFQRARLTGEEFEAVEYVRNRPVGRVVVAHGVPGDQANPGRFRDENDEGFVEPSAALADQRPPEGVRNVNVYVHFIRHRAAGGQGERIEIVAQSLRPLPTPSVVRQRIPIPPVSQEPLPAPPVVQEPLPAPPVVQEPLPAPPVVQEPLLSPGSVDDEDEPLGPMFDEPLDSLGPPGHNPFGGNLELPGQHYRNLPQRNQRRSQPKECKGKKHMRF